jgi:hypothetical protein
LTSLGSQPEKEAFEEFVATVGGDLSKLREVTRSSQFSLDVTDLDSVDLRRALHSEFKNTQQQVLVAWPADRTAARIDLQAVIERIDDLWYPSMDDMVIILSKPEGKQVIVLNHEERLSVTTLPA